VVLIVAAAFPPDPLSGAARPGRFAKYLAGFGYEPIVLCQSSPDRAVGSPGVRRVPGPSPGLKARALSGSGRFVQRYIVPYNDSLPWAAHALVEAEAVIGRHPVCAVLSTSPPVATHLVALWLKRRHGLPWVADFRDPLWGNPFRPRRWIFPYDAMLERRIFRHADALIANTDTTAEMWRLRHPDAARKVNVIWNGFDPEDSIEVPPVADSGRRVLAHVGSLYGGRHPGRLLVSMARLIRRGELAADRLTVRLVGRIEDDCMRVIGEVAGDLKERGCLEYDGRSVPAEEARRASTEADYLLLLDLNEKATDLQIPAKLFDYIRIGRPILALTRNGSPTDRILRGSGVPCRIVDQDASEGEVDRALLGLLEMPPDPVRPSAWFEDQFDGKNQTRMLADIIHSLRAGLGRMPSSPG
jgi:glycosyltransferase involved in cell wall biosynthesis